MTDPKDLERRDILRYGLSLATACLMPNAAGAVPASSRTDRWMECSARIFPHRESARFIGQRYLASAPDASRPIAAAFRRLEQQSAGSHGVTDEALIIAAVQSDYEHSRIVNVDGWALSETEVAFCVLSAFGQA